MKLDLDRELISELQAWHGQRLLKKSERRLHLLKLFRGKLDAIPNAKGVYFPQLVSRVLMHRDFTSLVIKLSNQGYIKLKEAKTLGVDTVFSKVFNKNVNVWSLGYYTEKLGGIRRSLQNTKEIRRYINEEAVEPLSQEEARLEALNVYVTSVLVALELADSFVQDKRGTRANKAYESIEFDNLGNKNVVYVHDPAKVENLKQTFCVVCWRLVQKEKDESVNSYTHYCEHHHSNQNTAGYEKQVRAIRNMFPDELLQSKGDIARKLNKLFDSLTVKINTMLLLQEVCPDALTDEKIFHDKIETNWLSITKRLLKVVSDAYPDTYERIKGTEENKGSWQDWIINGVIPVLCDKGEHRETDYWKANKDLTDPVNWRIILYLFRRYQSSQILIKNIAPAGRPPSKSLVVQAYLQDCLENKRAIPNDTALSKILDVSTTTISNVKYELGIRVRKRLNIKK